MTHDEAKRQFEARRQQLILMILGFVGLFSGMLLNALYKMPHTHQPMIPPIVFVLATAVWTVICLDVGKNDKPILDLFKVVGGALTLVALGLQVALKVSF